jgi:hypothetical protein
MLTDKIRSEKNELKLEVTEEINLLRKILYFQGDLIR